MKSSENPEDMLGDRKALIDSIGDDRHTLKASSEIVTGYVLAYYMLGFLLALFIVIFLPIRSGDTRILLAGTMPLPVCSLIGWHLWRRSRTKSVSFDRYGFRIYEGQFSTFEQRWDQISSIQGKRAKLVVNRHVGGSTSITIPDVKRTRQAQLLLDILRTYAVPVDVEGKRRKWLIIFVVMMVVGLVVVVGMGRPELMRKDYEGPVGPSQYFWAIVWGLVGSLMMVSVHCLGYFFMRWATTLEFTKARKRVSSFGPNVQEHIDANNGWPKPIVLEPGKKYRYLDPDGVRNAPKEMVVSVWILSGLLFALALMAPVAHFVGPRIRHEDDVALVAIFISLTVLALLPLGFISYYRKRLAFADDILAVDATALIVTRGSETKRYPRKPIKEMKDEFAPKEQKKPFARSERHGEKPDIYLVDRRYLLEWDEGAALRLSGEDIVGDGVEHVPG